MKVYYACDQCFQNFKIDTEPCFICGNNKFIKFVDYLEWEFIPFWKRNKNWLPKEEYFKRMKLLSLFSEEELQKIKESKNATI